MLAGFTMEQIDDMDPARRQRLLWRLHVTPWHELSRNPFLDRNGHTAIDLLMLPPDSPERLN